MRNDSDKDVYRWIAKQERKKKLDKFKPYIAGVILIVALLFFWMLKNTRFIVFLTLPEIIGIAIALIVLLGLLFFL